MGESVDMADTAPFGVAILDIHDGEWALWQVSTDRAKGPMRAIATNAVVSTGFDEKAFRSLAGDRQVLLTARAKNKCTEPLVLEAVPFSPSDFLDLCSTWVDMLEDLFQAENLRRTEFNSAKVQERKDARAAGQKPGEYKRLAPLTGVDWPLPPPSSLWESQIDCTEPVVDQRYELRTAARAY